MLYTTIFDILLYFTILYYTTLYYFMAAMCFIVRVWRRNVAVIFARATHIDRARKCVTYAGATVAGRDV